MAEAKIRASLFVDNLPYFYEATVCTFSPGRSLQRGRQREDVFKTEGNLTKTDCCERQCGKNGAVPNSLP
jgi:hypothetical protein